MDSTRQLKVARLVQKELSNFFMISGRSYFGNAMITVTQVGVTKDLSIARVYVSLFATPDKEALLNQIKGKLKHIRQDLGKRIGKQVRIIPEIELFLDDSLDYIEKIDELLKK